MVASINTTLLNPAQQLPAMPRVGDPELDCWLSIILPCQSSCLVAPTKPVIIPYEIDRLGNTLSGGVQSACVVVLFWHETHRLWSIYACAVCGLVDFPRVSISQPPLLSTTARQYPISYRR